MVSITQVGNTAYSPCHVVRALIICKDIEFQDAQRNFFNHHHHFAASCLFKISNELSDNAVIRAVVVAQRRASMVQSDNLSRDTRNDSVESMGANMMQLFISIIPQQQHELSRASGRMPLCLVFIGCRPRSRLNDGRLVRDQSVGILSMCCVL
jgi:hypothetical protein